MQNVLTLPVASTSTWLCSQTISGMSSTAMRCDSVATSGIASSVTSNARSIRYLGMPILQPIPVTQQSRPACERPSTPFLPFAETSSACSERARTSAGFGGLTRSAPRMKDWNALGGQEGRDDQGKDRSGDGGGCVDDAPRVGHGERVGSRPGLPQRSLVQRYRSERPDRQA